MYETSDIRKNLKFELDGDPYVVVDFQFVKPGKGTAFTRTRIRNLKTGRTLEKTFKTGEQLKEVALEERDVQYLYNDGATYTFMDNDNYEQVEIGADFLDDAKNFLLENMRVKVLFHDGSPISIELPTFVDLLITYCEPGVRGDTATGTTKPATLQTGAVVNVPLFINDGEVIRIDTRTGEYNSRVK
ncbi:MAG: elongation factor P [Myxococcales bacterium]|nr:elongation factor P [Myxococcales bacterium]